MLRKTFLAIGLGTVLVSAAEKAPVRVVRAPGALNVVKAQAKDGAVHLVYDSKTGPGYATTRDGGKTFSEPILAVVTNERPELEFDIWDMALSSEGTVHVAMGNNAWKLKLPQEEWGYFYARKKASERSFDPVRNINRKPSEGFSVTVNKSGDVVTAFLSGKVFVMDSTNRGETFSAPRELTGGWNACDCCTTAITYGADGRVALLYREETDNKRDMYLMLWNQKSNTVDRRRISQTDWLMPACPMTYYSITATTNGYLAAWPTKGEIYWARLNVNGEVLAPGEIKTSGRNGMRTGLVPINGSNGRVLIAWNDGSSLRWEAFDEGGRPIGQAGKTETSGKGAAGVWLENEFLLFAAPK
ncbi:MAG TPA: hypothetical protein VF773_10975 [Verrucomicrobiae bacterium]